MFEDETPNVGEDLAPMDMMHLWLLFLLTRDNLQK